MCYSVLTVDAIDLELRRVLLDNRRHDRIYAASPLLLNLSI